jgi:galactose mutarotase-like enzyme
LPNFGPGGKSGQPQHGFGRTSDWEVTDKTENGIILTLAEGEGEYKDMASVLAYQLADNMIRITCEVTNNGTAAVRLAPAFHPYFSLTGEKDVMIDETKELLDDLAEAQFFEGTTHTLNTKARTFEMTSTELPTWAKWTDQLGKYVCVEPSRGGFTFLNSEPSEDEILAAGASKTYGVSITWS